MMAKGFSSSGGISTFHDGYPNQSISNDFVQSNPNKRDMFYEEMKDFINSTFELWLEKNKEYTNDNPENVLYNFDVASKRNSKPTVAIIWEWMDKHTNSIFIDKEQGLKHLSLKQFDSKIKDIMVYLMLLREEKKRVLK
jgi:hypothetical protein